MVLEVRPQSYLALGLATRYLKPASAIAYVPQDLVERGGRHQEREWRETYDGADLVEALLHVRFFAPLADDHVELGFRLATGAAILRWDLEHSDYTGLGLAILGGPRLDLRVAPAWTLYLQAEAGVHLNDDLDSGQDALRFVMASLSVGFAYRLTTWPGAPRPSP